MERYFLQNDISVFGFEVPSFPEGIEAAFDRLVAMLPRDNRPFYGISACIDGKMTYKATALETQQGEAEKYHCRRYVVEKGLYFSVTITDWRKKTGTIKDVFKKMLQHDLADNSKPLIEVYKDDQEMYCLVKIDEQKEVLAEFDSTMHKLAQQLASFDERAFNAHLTEETWTPGQVAEHLLKSISVISRLISAPGAPTDRNYREKVETIKSDFGNYNIKMQAPEFVVPENKHFDKEAMIRTLQAKRDEIKKTIPSLDLTQTCTTFSLPVSGMLTKIEWLYFVICHTQRHLHQLRQLHQKLNQSSRPASS